MGSQPEDRLGVRLIKAAREWLERRHRDRLLCELDRHTLIDIGLLPPGGRDDRCSLARTRSRLWASYFW